MGGPPYVVESWTGQTFDPATPLDLTTIQNALIAQLKTVFPPNAGILITGFPDQGPKYRMVNQQGALLLRWDSNSYDPLRDVGKSVQEQNISWSINVLARSLGWDFGQTKKYGSYQLIQLVRQALLGFHVPGTTRKIYARTETYKDFVEGVWWYECIYAHAAMGVQVYTPPNYPPFTKGLVFEEGGITTRTGGGSYQFNNATPQIVTIGIQNLQTVVVSIGDTTYVELTDYSVDRVNGVIARIAAGHIPSQATVNVSYSFGEVFEAVSTGGSAPTAPSN